MKRILCLICLAATLALAGEVMAYSVTLTPSFQNIMVGENATLDVNLNLGPEEELFGFNFLLSFDPSIVKFNTLTFSNLLDNYITGFTPPSAGVPDAVTFDGALDFAFDEGVTTSIPGLASISFTGVGAGTTQFNLSGAVLDMEGFEEIPLTASASANVVPEPGTIVLLGVGLAGLALRNRRTKA